uniref:CX domain-containing protein n=1 Tax=Elaeophora elaphi TaxID=1147741 RepID=A0A0R3RP19_9BILA
CEGLSATVIGGVERAVISSGGGGFISTYIGSSGVDWMMPSVQIQAPQVQFPASVNIIPQQPSVFYQVQPFIKIQQSKVSTECCAPCPDGNGICCCTPGATTVAPRDTFHPPYYPAGAGIPSKSISLLVSIVILLLLQYTS